MLVSARKLNQLGVVEAALEPPRLVEETARVLSAAELVAESGPELVPARAAERGSPPSRAAAAGAPRRQRGRLSYPCGGQGICLVRSGREQRCRSAHGRRA